MSNMRAVAGKMTGMKGGADRTREVRAMMNMNPRVYGRRQGNYMGTTRKRDLRIWPHSFFSDGAFRVTFGPRSSNPKTRKVAKRRERHYAKHSMIFANSSLEQAKSFRETHTLSGRKKNRNS